MTPPLVPPPETGLPPTGPSDLSAAAAEADSVRVAVDPGLAERAVWRAIRAGQVRRGTLAAHRRNAEAAYTLADPVERDRAFGRAAQAEFEALRLADPVIAALREQPTLADRVGLLLIGEARGRMDEGVTCEPGGGQLGVRLEAARFEQPEGLLRWSRHALGHTLDTLDPDFHFERGWQEQGRTPVAVQARLHRLWDITVDARLVGRGVLDPVTSRERHVAALAEDLPGIAPGTADKVVGWLWAGPRPSFPELLALAAHPADLVTVAAPDDAAPPHPDRCPLCRFPDLAVRPPAANIAMLVRAEYPAWRPEQGLCARCTDRYRFIARPGGGRWTS